MPYKDPEHQRLYQQDWYRKHREECRTSSVKNRRMRHREVEQIKESRGCEECLKPFPYYVLDFDHREGTKKLCKINSLIKYAAREVVLAEIAKCDVVCANCHRIRTFKRMKKARTLKQQAVDIV